MPPRMMTPDTNQQLDLQGQEQEAVPTIPFHDPARSHMHGKRQTPLLEVQRDELLAELLGDTFKINEQLAEFSRRIEELNSSLTVADFVRWKKTIDSKLSELGHVNLSQEAANRLQSVASAYVSQLSIETNRVIHIQVKKAVSETLGFQVLFDKLQKEWLLRVGILAGTVFGANLLANFVWKIL